VSAPRRRRPAPTVTEINLFRYVPRSSPVHRLWAGTKVVGLVAFGIAISLEPSWAGAGLVIAVLAGTMALARVPVGAVPRFPRWFWIGVLLTVVSAFLAGGKPELHVGRSSIGLGGLDRWGLFTLLVIIFIWTTSVVGWTTRGGELTPALATLAAPARLVRIPVNEVVVVVALGVRSMPLLVDELRTLWAARRVRNPPQPDSLREIVEQVHDVIVTALVSSARRAQEMADAIEARGGFGSVVPSRPRLVLPEVVAWVVIVGVVAGVILL
jgi:energy-coupling factor transporter transmembrane protein EcfT